MVHMYRCWVCGKVLSEKDVLPDTCNHCSQLKPKKEKKNESRR